MPLPRDAFFAIFIKRWKTVSIVAVLFKVDDAAAVLLLVLLLLVDIM
jgi:hypothetical protein